MSTRRRLTLTALVTLCASSVGLKLSSTLALAGTGYRLEHSFGSEGSSEGQFNGAGGIAVNQATGDVYVVDQFNNRVERFDANGTYIGQFNGSGEAPAALASPGAIAVDNSCYLQHKGPSECASFDPSNGDVYVADLGNNVIDKFSPAGRYEGQLTETSAGEPLGELNGGLVVDANGTIWLYRTSGEIDRFTSSLINTFLPPKLTSPQSPGFGGFAVDSHEDLYVKTGSNEISKLNGSGALLVAEACGGEVHGEAPAGVAVDLANDDVFVVDGESVRVCDEAGSPLAIIGLAAEHAARGIGIDSATGSVYVSEFGQVDIFASGPTPPPPNTDAVTNLTATTATLNGDLNPGGVPGGVGFQFSYDLGASCTGPGSTTTRPGNATGSVDVPESGAATGLEPSAHYAACFLATSEFGATPGPTVTFETPPAAPSVDRQSTSGVTLTEATLQAQLNPNNQETTYSFQYASNEGLAGATTIPGAGPLSGFGDQEVSVSTGSLLAPATTYWFRVIAENASDEKTGGPVEQFTTLPFPPTVSIAGASAGAETATVTFTVNPQGGNTRYAVRYGTSTAYIAQVQGDAGASRGAVPITVSLPELAPGTLYHLSVSVQSAGGEEATPDQTFNTSEAPPAPAGGASSTAEEAPTVALGLERPATPPLLALPAIVLPPKPPPPSSGPLTRKQKLQRALAQCRKDRVRKRRASCERAARRRY